VAVTNGSATITGTGTAWLDAVQQGWAFYGPDGRPYQVLTVNSNTSITLARNYAGTTTTGAQYDIVPTQALVRTLAQRVADLIATYSGFVTTRLAGLFGAGSASTPGVAREGDANTGVFWPADDALAVATGGVERMRLDSSGRVAVGVADASIGGGRMVIQHSANNGLVVDSLGGAATLYLRNAADSTPSKLQFMQGNGLSLADQNGNERMRIDATGNLSVGAANSAGYRLRVVASSPQGLIWGTANNATFGSPSVYLTDLLNNTDLVLTPNGTESSIGTFSATPLVLRTAQAERMRIDASGNVGLGGTPSANRLKVYGDIECDVTGRTFFCNNLGAVSSAAPLSFLSNSTFEWKNTSGTERMRIDASGNWILRNPPTSPPTLTTNGDLTITATSNTNARISYRGSDGVTRVGNIPLA
jgi:hypothetical protein